MQLSKHRVDFPFPAPGKVPFYRETSDTNFERPTRMVKMAKDKDPTNHANETPIMANPNDTKTNANA